MDGIQKHRIVETMTHEHATLLAFEGHIVFAQVIETGSYAGERRCGFSRSAPSGEEYAFSVARHQAGVDHLNILIIVPLQEKAGEGLCSFVDKDFIVPSDGC